LPSTNTSGGRAAMSITTSVSKESNFMLSL
jgi:hypothetical protein